MDSSLTGVTALYPNSSLVLVQPRKIRPFITERLLMVRKKSNQTNKIHLTYVLVLKSIVSYSNTPLSIYQDIKGPLKFSNQQKLGYMRMTVDIFLNALCRQTNYGLD